MHTLYDVETQVPAFVHITEAKIPDSKAMPMIPYEPAAHYIFDRSYNNFGNLYTIHIGISQNNGVNWGFMNNHEDLLTILEKSYPAEVVIAVMNY